MSHTKKNPTTIGIDLAKNIFHLYALDEDGNTLWERAMNPQNATATLQSLPPCIIGIEACGGSHYWHRTFSELGHDVHMITPQRARAFREGQKNDRNDAQAIAHAVMNKNTRLVAPKTIEQQQISSLHAMRKVEVKQRTQKINHMRGTLAEYGISVKKGARWFEDNIDGILGEAQKNKRLPEVVMNWVYDGHIMLFVRLSHHLPPIIFYFFILY